MYSSHYSCQILIKLEFSRQIFEKYPILNFMQICPVGTAVFHVKGRTDIMKLTVTLHNTANAPTKKITSATRLSCN